MIKKLILFVMLAGAAFGQGSGVYNPPSQRDLVRAGAVLSSGGQATNLTVSGELTVSTVFSNRPAAISGTEAGAFAGYYYYAGTDTLFGDYFTNEQGCTLYMDIEWFYAGSWLLKSANGEIILFFNGERWMYPLGELIDIEFSEIPFHGKVGGTIIAEKGFNSDALFLGSDALLTDHGKPEWNSGPGFLIKGDGSPFRSVTGGLIFGGGQAILDIGVNCAPFTGFGNSNLEYDSWLFRIQTNKGFPTGFQVLHDPAADGGFVLFSVSADRVGSEYLPADFTGYRVSGSEGITTNVTFNGTNKLNIVGGIIVGINN
jgi:hypothetical protein